MANSIIYARRTSVVFAGAIKTDGYQVESTGEFRVGLTGASTSVGYSKEWLGRAIERGGNTLKSLREEGFKGNILKVATPQTREGGGGAVTISLDDYEAVIATAAYAGQTAARIFSRALRRIALEDFFRDAFDRLPMSMEEKRNIFYKALAGTIDWSAEDKKDAYDLISFRG